MRYILEVYEPEDDTTVTFQVESGQPFSAVSVGDLLHHQTMRLNARLKVTTIEHLFWSTDEGGAQKTCIRTVSADF